MESQGPFQTQEPWDLLDVNIGTWRVAFLLKLGQPVGSADSRVSKRFFPATQTNSSIGPATNLRGPHNSSTIFSFFWEYNGLKMKPVCSWYIWGIFYPSQSSDSIQKGRDLVSLPTDRKWPRHRLQSLEIGASFWQEWSQWDFTRPRRKLDEESKSCVTSQPGSS